MRDGNLRVVRCRDATNHDSLIPKVATGVVMGLAADGYRLAIDAMVRRLPATELRA
jgi:3-dehydroquinate dehydratase